MSHFICAKLSVSRFAVAFAIAVSGVLLVTPSNAVTLFDSNGFTGYTVGNLIGQNGWDSFPAASTRFAVVNNAGNNIVTAAGGSATVNYAFPDLSFTPAANETVNVSIDLARSLGATAAASSASYGIDVYSSVNRITRFGLNRQTNTTLGLFVTAPFNTGTGQFQAGSPLFNVTIATGLTPSTFYNLEARLNFTTKQFNLFSNNALVLGNIPFADATATDIADADIYVASSATATDTGFFDNYRVTTTLAVVPETNTLALLAFGVAPVAGAVIDRRRKQA